MFELARRRALEALATGSGIDEDIIEILDEINRREEYYTTSSCSGRIVLISLPEAGAKKEAKFVAKWHRPVSFEELQNSLKIWADNMHRGEELWLLAQSPIIHVAAKDLSSAKQILKVAVAAGFKYSSIKSVSADRTVVEILSTERMDVPLGIDGEIFCDERFLRFVLERANFVLQRGKRKLEKLLSTLKKLK